MTPHDQGHPPPDGDLRPTAYAWKGMLVLARKLSNAELQERADSFLSGLTRSLAEEGCRLIGHIKGILEAGDKGQLFFSTTSFDRRPRHKGGLTGSFEKIDFTLNVIVYGVGMEKIEELVLAGLCRHLGEIFPKNQEGPPPPSGHLKKAKR